jgi:hypothetical protein
VGRQARALLDQSIQLPSHAGPCRAELDRLCTVSPASRPCVPNPLPPPLSANSLPHPPPHPTPPHPLLAGQAGGPGHGRRVPALGAGARLPGLHTRHGLLPLRCSAAAPCSHAWSVPGPPGRGAHQRTAHRLAARSPEVMARAGGGGGHRGEAAAALAGVHAWHVLACAGRARRAGAAAAALAPRKGAGPAARLRAGAGQAPTAGIHRPSPTAHRTAGARPATRRWCGCPTPASSPPTTRPPSSRPSASSRGAYQPWRLLLCNPLQPPAATDQR